MGCFQVAKFSRFSLKNMAIIFRRFKFSRSATSAKNNFDSLPQKSWTGGITRLSLDRFTVQKENLRQKYLKHMGIKDKKDKKTHKKTRKEHIYIQIVE